MAVVQFLKTKKFKLKKYKNEGTLQNLNFGVEDARECGRQWSRIKDFNSKIELKEAIKKDEGTCWTGWHDVKTDWENQLEITRARHVGKRQLHPM